MFYHYCARVSIKVTVIKKKKEPIGRPKNKTIEPKKGLTINLPIPLSDKIEENAKRNSRSKTQEIIHALKTLYLPEEIR